jgi:hypothetical protein
MRAVRTDFARSHRALTRLSYTKEQLMQTVGLSDGRAD